MPIKTACPDCDKAYTLADTMEGKTVKCKDCGNPFTVEPEAKANGVATKPSNGKSAATKAVKPAVKKKGGADDDDDDEAKPVKKKGGGKGMILMIGGGVALVVMLFVCAGGGLGGYFLFFRGTKVTKENFDKLRDGMSESEVRDILGRPDEGGTLLGIGSVTYKHGDDSISMAYFDGKATMITGVFDGQMYTAPGGDKVADNKNNNNNNNDPKNEDTKPANKVTLANYQRIKVGMAMEEVEGFLGKSFSKLNVGDNRTVSETWVAAADMIQVVFYDGKVQSYSGTFNNKPYSSLTDPGNTPKPTSRLTVDKFNKIKGGNGPQELITLLGPPTQLNVKPDATALPLVGDRGTAQIWKDGTDSITVNFTADNKAVIWTANIGGANLTNQDPTYAVKPATSPITKATFDQIKGGENQDQIKALMTGAKLNPNTGATDGESAKYDKVRIDTWYDTMNNNITVVYCNGSVARWYGTIGGVAYGPLKNDQFVILKNNNPNPNPNPNTKLTKDFYNKVVDNKTTILEVGQYLGPNVQIGTVGNGKNARATYTWMEGNAKVTFHVNPANGVITNKYEENLK